jgi:hypothetical protein
MSKDWVADIHSMHDKFGVHTWVKEQVETGNFEKLLKFLEFRIKFLYEELDETTDLGVMDRNSEEIVDGLIDLCVVAIGTLDAFNVDANKAWDAVHDANMAKVPGVKKERPNPLGLPDLMKPEGWVAPSHEGNHGLFNAI